MKVAAAFILVLLNAFLLNGQSIQEKYDSANVLIEKARLAPAVELFKEISEELLQKKLYEEFFTARYYICASYAILENNPQATRDSLEFYLEKAISLTNDQSIPAAEIYFGLGWWHDSFALDVDAEKYYQKAYEIRRAELGDNHKKTLKSLSNYSQVLTVVGKLGRVEKNLQLLLKEYKSLYPPGHPEFSRVYTLAHHFYIGISEYDKALSYALLALDVGKKNYGINNPRLLRLIRNVSYDYYYLGKIEQAMDYANEELVLVKALTGGEPHIRMAEILNNQGRFLDKSKQYHKSKELYQEALMLKTQLIGSENISTLSTAINLVYALGKSGEIEQSSAQLSEILSVLSKLGDDILEVNTMRAHVHLVENLGLMGQQDSCFQIVEEYFQKFEDAFVVQSLGNDQHLNMMAMVEDLVALYLKESASSQQIDLIEEMVTHLDSLNRKTLELRNLKADQMNFLDSYAAFNGIGIDYYNKRFNESNEESHFNEVLRFSEKNKANILNPAYTIARLKDGLNIPVDVLEKERELLAKISGEEEENSGEMLRNKLAYDSIVEHLKSNYPQYHRIKYGNSKITVSELQDKLSNDQILISYSMAEANLYRILIEKERFNVTRIDQSTLNQEIEEFRREIESLEDIDASASKLYKTLIDNQYNGKKIVIFPEGYLSFLPFDLLQDKTGFFGLQNIISYSPSIDLWLKSREIGQYPNNKLLAMAPEFSEEGSEPGETREQLLPIFGAIEEIQSIEKAFTGTTFLGPTATKEEFLKKSKDFGLIHLATHAIVNAENPEFSRLYFNSSDSVENLDFLSNYDLYNLDINANLVTLSACNSGVGEIQNGDGAISLARGFMYAGASATLVSLWSASDRSTAEVMKFFYENLKEGQPKDEALYNARKQYLETAQKKGKHPFYWGGFVLIGDSTPIKKEFPWLYLGIGLFLLMSIVYFFAARASKK